MTFGTQGQGTRTSTRTSTSGPRITQAKKHQRTSSTSTSASTSTSTGGIKPPVIDVVEAGNMQVRGKGQLPEQPMIGKARQHTKKPENKNSADRESTASTCTSAKGHQQGAQDAGPPSTCTSTSTCTGEAEPPVTHVVKAGYMTGRGKGKLPEQPMIVKARYFTNEAENKTSTDGESTASTRTSAQGPGQVQKLPPPTPPHGSGYCQPRRRRR